MFLEVFIAFFLILHLRKTLRTFHPDPLWDKRLTIAMYAVAVLAILEVFLDIEQISKWIWHLLLLGIIIVTFKKPAFFSARITMYAVLPLAVITFVSDIVELITTDLYVTVEKYELCFPGSYYLDDSFINTLKETI
ncbi:MAG: hypothetical protein ABR503_15430 [Chitinophagaceae bacterium]